MTPHRQARLTQEDADWLREEMCQCNDIILACRFCDLAMKIEAHLKLESELEDIVAGTDHYARGKKRHSGPQEEH